MRDESARTLGRSYSNWNALETFTPGKKPGRVVGSVPTQTLRYRSPRTDPNKFSPSSEGINRSTLRVSRTEQPTGLFRPRRNTSYLAVVLSINAVKDSSFHKNKWETQGAKY